MHDNVNHHQDNTRDQHVNTFRGEGGGRKGGEGKKGGGGEGGHIGMTIADGDDCCDSVLLSRTLPCSHL